MSCTLHTLANEKLIELEKNGEKTGLLRGTVFLITVFFKFISILFGVLIFDV